MKKTLPFALIGILVTTTSLADATKEPLDVMVANTPLPVEMKSDLLITTSGYTVILAGAHRATAFLSVPSCTQPNRFLVTGIHVAPEFSVGNTNHDVVQLGRWGAEVPLYQVHPQNTGGSNRNFNVIGDGPQHLSAALPAGQAWIFSGDLPVTVALMDGMAHPATARFEFSIHITGRCGVAWFVP